MTLLFIHYLLFLPCLDPRSGGRKCPFPFSSDLTFFDRIFPFSKDYFVFCLPEPKLMQAPSDLFPTRCRPLPCVGSGRSSGGTHELPYNSRLDESYKTKTKHFYEYDSSMVFLLLFNVTNSTQPTTISVDIFVTSMVLG